jgi:salicylate hydroxylase
MKSTDVYQLGSGIQLPPNATKILGDLGLAEALRAVATSPHEIDFRSYRDGDLLSKARLIPDMEVLYGAPHLVLHRGDLLALLVREAQLYGVNIVTDCMAARIDFSACTVCTVSGRVFTGDVLIGADGIKSAARDACLAKDTSPQPTGRLVYRLTIPTHKITANPNIRALVEPEKITCWMGPDAHVVCYNLTGKDICSVVLTRLDRNPAPPSTLNPQSAPMEELRAFFTGWDKQLRALLELATSALYWPLLGYQQNDSWTVSNRPFILIGDAAHNMEPHL